MIYGISTSLLGELGSISNLRSHTIRSGKQIKKIRKVNKSREHIVGVYVRRAVNGFPVGFQDFYQNE